MRSIALLLLLCLVQPLPAQTLIRRDQWGFGRYSAMTRQGDLLFMVGDWHGLGLFRYADDQFERLGEASFPSSVLAPVQSRFFSVAVSGNRLFAGAPDGLFEFDISNLDQPVPVGRISSDPIQAMAQEGNLLILAQGDLVKIHSLATTSLPMLSSIALTGPRALRLEGLNLWIVDAGGLKCYDLADPTSPQTKGELSGQNFEGPIGRDGMFLLIPVGTDLAVIDTTSPATPIFSHNAATGITPVSDIYRTTAGLYVLGGSTGFGTCRLFSVDPGYQLTPLMRLHIQGKRGQVLLFDSTLAFTSTTKGLEVVKERLDDAPVLLDERTIEGVTDLAFGSTKGYIATPQGIEIVDPGSGTLNPLTTFGSGGARLAIDLNRAYLFAAEPEQTLETWDLAQPSPTSLGSMTLDHGVAQIKLAIGRLGIMDTQRFSWFTAPAGMPQLYESYDLQKWGTATAFGPEPYDGITIFIDPLGFASVFNAPDSFTLPPGTRAIKDITVSGDFSVTLGDDFVYGNPFDHYHGKIENVHGTQVETNQNNIWTDGLGQSLSSFGFSVIRRFEIPQQGRMALNGQHALVQDQNQVRLYDMTPLTPPPTIHPILPLGVLRVFRVGHDLWAATGYKLFLLNDADSNFLQVTEVTDSCEDVVVSGTTAFVHFFTTLTSFDISDPSSPIQLDTLQIGDKVFDHNMVLGENYIAIRTPNRQLGKLDISDPGDLRLVETIPGQLFSNVAKDNDHLYVVADFGLKILRTSDMAYLYDHRDFYCHALAVHDQTLYGLDQGLRTFDVSNPANPVETSFIPDIIADRIATDGRHLFLSGRSHELIVFSIANHHQPVYITTIPDMGYVVEARPEGLLIASRLDANLAKWTYCIDHAELAVLIAQWPNTSVLAMVDIIHNLCVPETR